MTGLPTWAVFAMVASAFAIPFAGMLTAFAAANRARAERDRLELVVRVVQADFKAAKDDARWLTIWLDDARGDAEDYLALAESYAAEADALRGRIGQACELLEGAG